MTVCAGYLVLQYGMPVGQVQCRVKIFMAAQAVNGCAVLFMYGMTGCTSDIGVLVAAMLIVPLFLLSTAEVSSSTEIDLESSMIFPMLASFEDRESWDPWVETDPSTKLAYANHSSRCRATNSSSTAPLVLLMRPLVSLMPSSGMPRCGPSKTRARPASYHSGDEFSTRRVRT